MQFHGFVLIPLAVLLALTGCTHAGNGPTAPTVTAIEEWSVVMNNDTSNQGRETLTQSSDGSITVQGRWEFVQQGIALHCPFSSGTAHIADTAISLEISGTATYTGAPPGYQTAPFTLSAPGVAHNGVSHGTFSITYAAAGWPPAVHGTFAAVRSSGGGITR